MHYPSIVSQADIEEFLQLLSELIVAGGVNPPGNESEVAAVVVRWCRKFGLNEIKVLSPKPNRDNVIAKLAGKIDGPTMIFNGHVDVVPVGDPNLWLTPPFKLTVKNNKLFGRGVADMKGPLAAMMMAIALVKRKKMPIRGNIVLQAVADEEEGGLYGTKFLLEQGELNGKIAIVGEPTSLNIGIAEKGLLHLKVIFTGKTAHGSSPELGANSIRAASAFIELLYKSKPREFHPILGSPTFNVGKIEGGIGFNIVPDLCEISLDRRTIPGESYVELCANIQRMVKSAAKIEHGINGSYEILEYAEPSELQSNNQLILTAKKVVAGVTGKVPKVIGFSGSTDSRFFRNQVKIPTILLGPSSLTQAHMINEYAELSELINGIEVYYRLIETYLKKN